ncbi:hypothetical protein [Cohnella terricola]|uniref:Uncharacterized protein n=1 Tax=Cohnella terricola TaxID=1289167 RepID=A0A559JGR7_9BACL|nr:hypothetical protein [Cohnella terricola]TVX99065.1 hypothetical protein FPZ45_14020 [Cohnella terricola]
MRNTVSVCLLGIGGLLLAVGFIAGIVSARDIYGDFQIEIAMYWWLSAVIAGFFFIGLAEIVNLLQKLLDQNSGATPLSSSAAASNIDEVETRIEESETKIKELTILINGERFKGQLWITKSDVRVIKKSMFQSDSDAQLVKVINKSDLSPHYERNNDYFVFSFHEGNNTGKLEFKTHNIYDYERIIHLLKTQD